MLFIIFVFYITQLFTSKVVKTVKSSIWSSVSKEMTKKHFREVYERKIKMTSFYNLEEVSKHNQQNDLWIVINNDVHDLTKFLKEHPGGEEVLLNLAGGDGTYCFNSIGHSTEAQQLCKLYKIGNLVGSNSKELTEGLNEKIQTSIVPNVNNDEEPWDYVEHKEQTSPWILVFVGLAVLVYAIIFYYIF